MQLCKQLGLLATYNSPGLRPHTHNTSPCRTFLIYYYFFLQAWLWGEKDGFVMSGYYTSSPLNKNVPRCHSPFLDNLRHDEAQLRAT